MKRIKKVAKFIKDNPEGVAYLVVCAAAGAVIGRQHVQIQNLRGALIKERTLVNDLLTPMVVDGFAAKFDSTRDKVVFFELARQPIMDQYFGSK